MLTDGRKRITMTDYFIVEVIKEIQGGKLFIELKFQYNNMQDYLEGKLKSKLKGKYKDWFFITMSISRVEAYNRILKYNDGSYNSMLQSIK